MGDPLRLEQVLQNLIQNAIKYSPNGGRIGVRVEARSRQAHISVSDQGIGIPEAAQPAVQPVLPRQQRAPAADQRDGHWPVCGEEIIQHAQWHCER